MNLAIVIVSWNVRDLLAACLESVFADIERSRLDAAVWVVDNASADDSPALVRERFPQAHLIAGNTNRGFAAANNLALRALGFQQTLPSSSPLTPPPSPLPTSPSPLPAPRPPAHAPRFVLLLNPDTVIQPGALATLVEFMRATPDAGVAGAKLLNPDGSLQECAFAFPGLWQAAFDLFPPAGALRRLAHSRLNGRYPRRLFEQGAPFRIGHPLGAAFIVRAEAIAAAGLMDEGYFMYCEEIDWAWRIRQAGWVAYCVPTAAVVHHSGQSTGQVKAESFVNLWRSRRRLYAAHAGRLVTWLTGRLVQLAMHRRARDASPEQRAAFQHVASLWQK